MKRTRSLHRVRRLAATGIHVLWACLLLSRQGAHPERGCGAVIPKSTSPSHLRSNLDVVDWMLPPGDYDAISRLPYQARRGRIRCCSQPWKSWFRDREPP